MTDIYDVAREICRTRGEDHEHPFAVFASAAMHAADAQHPAALALLREHMRDVRKQIEIANRFEQCDWGACRRRQAAVRHQVVGEWVARMRLARLPAWQSGFALDAAGGDAVAALAIVMSGEKTAEMTKEMPAVV